MGVGCVARFITLLGDSGPDSGPGVPGLPIIRLGQ